VTQLEDALEQLLAAAAPLPKETIPTGEAAGRVAAEDIAAPSPVPHFRRPAMDGYVCHDADIHDSSPERPVFLRITREVLMGETPGPGPAAGEAWLITTGGPMPLHGDRVLPIEAVRRSGDRLRVERPGEGKTNISEPGEEIQEGAPLVSAGDVISAPIAGALAGCGILRLAVYRSPRVALLATGSELVEATEGAAEIPPGRIVNSNSVTLGGLLRTLGCSVAYKGIVSDHPEELRERLAALREGYDVVISTGGVSVGRRDAVHRTWLSLGVRRTVGRINLKPGGPFFAGRLGDTWTIGLSGTPVACLAAFHLVVQPFLRRLAGRRHTVRPVRVGRITCAFSRPSVTMRALWARVTDDEPGLPAVEILTGRPGGTVASLLPAGGLVLLPPGTPPLPPGSRVSVLMLDREEDRDRLVLHPPTLPPLMVGVTGESGSGKTAVIAGLIRHLAPEGVRVAAVKHAPHGFDVDRPTSDSARMAEAGAAVVVLAGAGETALRIAGPMDDTARIARLAADVGARVLGAAPEVILVEGFQHSDRPVIQVGRQKPGTRAGEVWAAIPAVEDLSPSQLAAELARLARIIRARLTAPPTPAAPLRDRLPHGDR
jgi:molybdopterin molybdotransferase